MLKLLLDVLHKKRKPKRVSQLATPHSQEEQNWYLNLGLLNTRPCTGPLPCPSAMLTCPSASTSPFLPGGPCPGPLTFTASQHSHIPAVPFLDIIQILPQVQLSPTAQPLSMPACLSLLHCQLSLKGQQDLTAMQPSSW